jgi:hypothetical protein
LSGRRENARHLGWIPLSKPGKPQRAERHEHCTYQYAAALHSFSSTMLRRCRRYRASLNRSLARLRQATECCGEISEELSCFGVRGFLALCSYSRASARYSLTVRMVVSQPLCLRGGRPVDRIRARDRANAARSRDVESSMRAGGTHAPVLARTRP